MPLPYERPFKVRFLLADGACLWEGMVRADTVVLALEKAFADLRHMAAPSGGIDLDRITRAEVIGGGGAGGGEWT